MSKIGSETATEPITNANDKWKKKRLRYRWLLSENIQLKYSEW
jgi:hypothetical protein